MPHDPFDSMSSAANAPAAWWTDLKVGLAFLTRLPIRLDTSLEAALPRATRAFPLVGLAVGLVGGVAYAVASGLALPPALAALVAVAATVLFTGALHEDGLADVADGFGGGFSRTRKLEIMRDSRTGAYGVLALVLTLLARVAALAALAEPHAVAAALIAAHAASRAVLSAVMHREALARDDGMAVAAGRPDRASALWALALGAIIALVALGLGTGILALVVGGLAAALLTWLARQQIGGYTGDVLGAIQQATEIAILLAVVAHA